MTDSQLTSRPAGAFTVQRERFSSSFSIADDVLHHPGEVRLIAPEGVEFAAPGG